MKKIFKKIVHRIVTIRCKILWKITREVEYLPNKEKSEELVREYIAADLKKQVIDDFKYVEGSDDIVLSLIVPVYNEEKNIKKCLDSLINQNTKYLYELIVLDNASTDSTPILLGKYEVNSKVKLITIKENKGGSVARNIGITYAKGRYIGFIDSDDRVSPDYVEKLIDTAIAENSDIVKCGYVLEKRNKVIKKKKKTSVNYNNGMGSYILEYDGYIWDAVYRRSLWEKIRFPEEYWYEDIIIKFLIFRQCKNFSYISDQLYYYYVNPYSTSKMQNKNSSLKCMEQYYLVKYYLDLSDNLGLKKDINLYRLLLHELGDILYKRTSCLDDLHRKAIFVLSAEIITKFKKEHLSKSIILPEDDFMIEKAFCEKNYKKWLLASQFKYHKKYQL